MFLPQRPYLSPGTLRDQVIYPDGHHDMRQKRKSEDDLKRVLEDAKLGYLPDREGGWDTRKEWKDVLSGGEKQRMGFARLLYHEPQYAIIDEGTSAVSSDVEGLLYETCKEKGISKWSACVGKSIPIFSRPFGPKFCCANEGWLRCSSHHGLDASLAQKVPHVQPGDWAGRERRQLGV